MINHSSIYHFSIISAYCCGGCTFTGVAQAWLELTLGEHLSAKSLKSLRAWILTTGEAAVGLEANRGTSHDSCERKQKRHNLISSPGCPFRLSLQTQGSSSPMICEGKKVGGRKCGRKAWTRLPWGMCYSGSDVILLVRPPEIYALDGCSPCFHLTIYSPMWAVQTLVMSSFRRVSKEVCASPSSEEHQWRLKANWKLGKWWVSFWVTVSQAHFFHLVFLI